MQISTIEATEVEVAPVTGIQTTCQSPSSPEAIGVATQGAFQTLGEFIQSRSVIPIGPPRSIYLAHGPDGTRFTVAFPVAAVKEGMLPESSSVSVGPLPAGPAWRFTHVGPYDKLGETYQRITNWLREQGHFETDADWAKYMPMWEEYVTDPGTTPASELVTYIYMPRR
jgi:effector-binding domain-containing protein